MAEVCFKTGDKLLFDAVKAAVEDSGAGTVVALEPADILVLDREKDILLPGVASLAKPFAMSALLSLVKARVSFSFCGLVVRPAERMVFCGEKSSALTAVETKFLEVLSGAKYGVRAEDAFGELFGYSSAAPSKVCATHIYNLRKKLSELSGRNDLIVFENGRYRLNV
jgi:DNA-binding response OmpR family regulator